MKNPVKVINSWFHATGDGNIRIFCGMSDYSTWSCNLDGENWREEKMSDEDLTKKFNQFLNEKS